MRRFRIAPSPTGNLHIGTLRTTLFNWILAQKEEGCLILRIEDTDQERSKSEFEANIIDGITWMGLTPHEGPIRQSDRMKDGIYQQYAKRLIDEKHAYLCFCSDAELDAERALAQSHNQPYRYSRKCHGLSKEDITSKIAQKIPFTVRFYIQDGPPIVFDDAIRGPISFDRHLLSDFVLVKSDKSPSYNFAVVVDDLDMAITDVVRGEDHISNTPRQLLLFEALGATPPQYAHLPMILGTDRSKLSKRHGATSVTQYRDMGYLPEAIFNYLVLLGWSSTTGEDILTQEQVIEEFSVSRISKSGAIFDIAKLKWMNGQYIRKLSPDNLVKALTPYVTPEALAMLQGMDSERVKRIFVSIQDNLDVLTDINVYVPVYLYGFDDFKKYVDSLTFTPQDLEVIKRFLDKCSGLTFDSKSIEDKLQETIQDTGLAKGKVLKPIRYASSGLGSGPHLPEFLSILTLKEVQKRLEYVLSK